MPIARIQLPDGRIARFEVPEGTTPQQAQAAAQAHLEAVHKQAVASASEDYDPTGSFLDNAAATFGRSFVNTARGATQLIDKSAQALANTEVGRAIDQLGQKMGLPSAAETGAANQAIIDRAKVADAPLTKTVGGVVGGLAGDVAQILYGGKAINAAVPLLPASATALRAAAAAKNANKLAQAAGYLPAAVGGAAWGGLQPTSTDDNKLTQIALGAVGGAAGQKVANAVVPAARAGVNAVSDSVRALAQKAEQYGIPLRADQILNNKPLNYLASVTESIPFSGAGASRDAQQAAFKTALAKTVGQNTDDLGKALTAADQQLGAEFDRVLQGTPVVADKQMADELLQKLTQAKRELSPDQFTVIKNQVDDLLGKVDDNGQILGQAAYGVKKTLDRLGKSTDSDKAHWAKEIRGTLMSALDRSLSPDEAAKFATTRQQYANMMQLEKLLANGAEGDISVARLANLRDIKTKDMQDLADIAAQFLKGKVPDSGTAQRGTTMAYLAGLVGPQALVTIPTANAVNRALGSNALRNYLLEGAPRLEATAPYANRLLPMLGMSAGAQAAK